MASDIDSLRCPRGCDVGFVQYLTYQREDDTEAGKLGSERAVESHWQGPVQVWHLWLRCGDCGLHYWVDGISRNAKQALDRLHAQVANALIEFAESLDPQDDDALARMIERNGIE